jgi:tetratricopeptide (TPR) repeat protein
MANESRWLAWALLALLACGALVPSGRVVAQAGPTDVEGAFARATELHQSGKLEEAIRAYQAILATHPNRPDVRSNLGAAYSRLGRYEEAVGQYKQALALDGRNQAIRFNLALAYYKSAWFAEAAGELAQFLAAAPRDLPERANAVLLLADCRVRLGEYKKVIESLTPLAEADPDGPNNRAVAYLLGNALIGDGQLDKGQLLIDRVFRDEESAEARLLVGSIQLLMDDGPAALKEFERASALNAKLPTLRAWQGRALMRMGDGEPNDARPLLEGVAKEHPDFVEARALLASVYYRLNRKEDGDRERAIVRKLNSEQQAQQPGVQKGAEAPPPPKAP